MALHYNFSIILLTLVVVNGELRDPVKITGGFKILPAITGRSLDKELGHIFRGRDCGGTSGRVLEVRYENCATGVPAICSEFVNRSGRAEITFVPTENINDPNVRVMVFTTDGQSKTYEMPMPNTNMIAGRTYVLKGNLAVTQELQGKFFTGQMQLVNKDDKEVGICAEAKFYMI